MIQTGENKITLRKLYATSLFLLFLSFRHVLNVIYSFWGNSPASEF